ncbi:MAG TPA: FecR family protein [Pyrinomonadaceae bacterium]|nr:FecR family protein [Pyrinomonadaceae bacterium]
MISARAGGINAITGQASVHSRGETDWQVLSITDDLDAGDRVRTANDGRVEILLNPGSYLRLGGDSEVELSNNTLENLEVRLLRGTAIVEATGADDLDLNINISTPHTKLAIVRQGLYRLNVVPENATELIVRKGRVILSDSHTKVKGGNKVIFAATNVSVAKLSKEEKKFDADVDSWSKDRGKMLAKANSRINDRTLSNVNTFFSDWDPFSRRVGVWVFNTQSRCYTFLPFFANWGSPYGSYTTSLYYPPAYYPYGVPQSNSNGNQPQTGSNGGHTYPSSGGNGGGSGSGGGHTYPSGGGGQRPSPPTPQPMSPPSGGYGSGRERIPNMETGRPMPTKNIEPSRPDQ